MTVQRLMRPWGHIGLIFTCGLTWALMAVAIHPTPRSRLAYLGGYVSCRIAITWMIGVAGMRQKGLWTKMPLIPLWDAVAFMIWVASFGRRTIRWRGFDYYLRDGKLVAAKPLLPRLNHERKSCGCRRWNLRSDDRHPPGRTGP